jgi:hypothetical protein
MVGLEICLRQWGIDKKSLATTTIVAVGEHVQYRSNTVNHSIKSTFMMDKDKTEMPIKQ